MRAAFFFATCLSGSLLLLAACQGDEEEVPGSSPLPTSAESTRTIDGLEVRLSIDKPAYRPGEPIRMSLTVTNTRHAAITLSFNSGQRYDFVATDESYTEVWRWSADKVFAQALGNEAIEPGEELAFTGLWDQRDSRGMQVPAGEYRITARITGCTAAQECDVAAQAGVEIVP